MKLNSFFLTLLFIAPHSSNGVCALRVSLLHLGNYEAHTLTEQVDVEVVGLLKMV